MSPPKISVLMSCYNAAQFLSEAIESILAQTFTDFEFILIDDGSTDDSLTIIKKYAAKDERIVLIEKENTGLTDSLNVGIGVAKGEWIARLDADDVALPSRLNEQISFVDQNQDVLLVGSGCTTIDENGVQAREYSYPTNHSDLLFRLKTSGAFFPHSSAMYRRDAVLAIGGYSKRMLCAEDIDLWFRLIEIGQVKCLNFPLVLLRKHSEQVSHVDQGKTQLVFASAARICHQLRSLNFQDPSVSNDEKWSEFISWIKDRLEQTGYFATMRFNDQLRESWYHRKERRIWSDRLSFTKKVVEHPIYCATIAWKKLFGSALPTQLADEWMRLRPF